MAKTEGLMLTATTDIMSYSYSGDEHYYDDYYSSNITDERCNKEAVIQFGAIFTPVFFSIVVIFSLFGNILIIVILAKYENFRSLTNTFILNLAISDLFFTAGLPFWAYYHMYGWDLGEVACKTVSFVFYIGFYSSGILLILMTAHRYVAVMNPLSNIVSATGGSSVITSVIIWAVSILVAIPGFCFTTSQSKHCVYKDSKWKLWGIYQQNVLFIVTLIIFVYCYAKIICRLLRPTVQRRRSKTLKLIFTLMVVFFVGWGPYNIALFLHSFSHWTTTSVDSKTLAAKCESEKSLDYALYVSRLFAFSHCCLNPVFYVFLGIKFKNHLKKMLKSWGNNKSSIHSRQSRLTITSVTSGEELSM
ncbi:Chemokine XC receptor 1 G-protein coupled receptor 5 Lymphotactin receptor XC chemokine receptor 1 [Channa argus]|uniref:Chemokine XC receptor 1 G-protein coupled receptor 5 Lymphotactin receptor XC chemokine receptor 1 n=1 Tax=Channa argus TaxID=215402 RepID=A0A6G1Q9H7_CHAAH|nr:Chemokine XC receptor 1 G-protein coupled receptor 5 Lymphotactin receptor XC chemokine receptor 1 [Channa argus]